MNHPDALQTVIAAANASLLSYQEAIELYLALRGIHAQAIEARQGGDAKQAPSQDESAVHAPNTETHRG